MNPDRFRLRRGTKNDDRHAARPSHCMIIDAPDHGAFATVVVRMNCEAKDRPEMVKRAHLLAASGDLLAALEDLIISQWLSIDHAHNRTQEAFARRSKAIAAIAKAKGET